MSGGGSDAQPFKPLNADPRDITEFGKTTVGQKYSPEELDILNRAGSSGQSYYTGPGPGQVNIDPMVTAFQQWKASQENLSSAAEQYTTLSNSAPGRDSTILTGARVNPNTILGGR